MKKLMLFLIFLFLPISVFCQYGYDADIGLLTDAKKGSVEESIINYFKKEYSLDFIENIVEKSCQKEFSLHYSSALIDILPLTNFYYSISDNIIKIKEIQKHLLITIFYQESGKVTSLSIKALD